MLKLVKVAIILIAAFLIFTSPVLAASEAVSSASFLTAENQNFRIDELRRFLSAYNSPLVGFADEFVEAADKYELDWRLIPAITGVESTFGKAIPTGSYNAYGWANGAFYFRSWEESINVVARALRENYINRGADTVEKIAPIYAPPSTTWAWKVRYFMEKMANFAPANTLALELSL